MQDWLQSLESLPLGFLIPAVILAIVVWFIPTIIAVFRNQANLGKIAAVNVPAGMSWIAWVALIAWAASGKGAADMPRTNINWGWVLAGLIAVIAGVTVAFNLV